jgi:hypothetical protein
MNPSEEQQTIIDLIKQRKNVIVDAVAGSGKSTTILLLAQQIPDKHILQVTYNSALRKEVKHKVEEQGLTNVLVHTYHSLATRFYMPTAHTDTELRNILRNKTENKTTLPAFDIVVLDEVQDMSKLYFMFIVKFLMDMVRENGNTVQLLILGDFMQGLYDFKGSDVRYLTLADKIWNRFPHLKTNDFIHCSLKMSYRITDPMAEFVNNVMLGENRLLSCKEGCKVVYIRNSYNQLLYGILYIIIKLLKEGYNPDDIFVLGPSMKKSIKKIENVLVEHQIPCYVPMPDKDKMDDRVIDKKVVFSTFHCVKGRQRKIVIVTGFDNGYFDYYGRELNRKKCPNTLYVGCTRATERMFVIEVDGHSSNKPLEFLKMNHLQMKRQPYIDFKGTIQMVQNVMKLEGPPHSNPNEEKFHINFTSPTDLIKFIPESVLDQLIPLVEGLFTKVSLTEEEIELDIPVVIETKAGFYEDVSDLNGIAIPCIYADKITGKNCLYDVIEQLFKEVKPGEFNYLKDIFKKAPKEITNVGDYLLLSNIYSALQEKLYFKIGQIQRNEYTWLNPKTIDTCMDRLDKVIQWDQVAPQIEVNIVMPTEEDNAEINELLKADFPKDKFYFSARIDMLCEDCIWELKCTSMITIEHFLQTIIYAWIWKVLNPKDEKQFKIFNIKTGQLYWLEKSSLENLTPLILLMLKAKYQKVDKMTDEAFLQDHATTL